MKNKHFSVVVCARSGQSYQQGAVKAPSLMSMMILITPQMFLPRCCHLPLLGLAFTNANEPARVASLIQHNAGVKPPGYSQDLYQLDGSLITSWTFEIYTGTLPPINSLIAKTGPTGLGPHYSGVGKT